MAIFSDCNSSTVVFQNVLKDRFHEFKNGPLYELRDVFQQEQFNTVDSKVITDHEILLTGKFDQNGHEFEVTKKDLERMVENFKAKVLGTDPPVDFSHNSEELAAGWIVGLNLSSGGESLEARIRWTPIGIKRIKNREFRYLSPSFTFDFFDGSTGKKFGPVLRGAGLTNIPFLRRMDPIVDLHEKNSTDKTKPMKGAEKMSEKKDEVVSLADHKAQTKILVDKTNELQDEVKNLTDQIEKLKPFEDKNKELSDKIAVLEDEKEKA